MIIGACLCLCSGAPPAGLRFSSDGTLGVEPIRPRPGRAAAVGAGRWQRAVLGAARCQQRPARCGRHSHARPAPA